MVLDAIYLFVGYTWKLSLVLLAFCGNNEAGFSIVIVSDCTASEPALHWGRDGSVCTAECFQMLIDAALILLCFAPRSPNANRKRRRRSKCWGRWIVAERNQICIVEAEFSVTHPVDRFRSCLVVSEDQHSEMIDIFIKASASSSIIAPT